MLASLHMSDFSYFFSFHVPSQPYQKRIIWVVRLIYFYFGSDTRFTLLDLLNQTQIFFLTKCALVDSFPIRATVDKECAAIGAGGVSPVSCYDEFSWICEKTYVNWLKESSAGLPRSEDWVNSRPCWLIKYLYPFVISLLHLL